MTRETRRTRPRRPPPAASAAFAGARVARLAAVSEAGVVLVSLDGERPRPARLLTGLDRAELAHERNAGREVLVVVPEGSSEDPIIVGMLESPLEELIVQGSETVDPEQREVRVDGERLVIEGKEEVVLKCGEASIVLRRDGKIVLRGTNLLSRSSGPNRIKGGSVALN